MMPKNTFQWRSISNVKFKLFPFSPTKPEALLTCQAVRAHFHVRKKHAFCKKRTWMEEIPGIVSKERIATFKRFLCCLQFPFKKTDVFAEVKYAYICCYFSCHKSNVHCVVKFPRERLHDKGLLTWRINGTLKHVQ